MKTKEMLEDIKNYSRDILAGRGLNPIIDIRITNDPTFIIKDNTLVYDVASQKLQFICCSEKDWIAFYKEKHPTCNVYDVLHQFAIPKGKERYKEYIVEKWVDLHTHPYNIPEYIHTALKKIDPQKKYLLNKDAYALLENLENIEDIPWICNEHQILFTEPMAMYWDGYGACIYNSTFIYGGSKEKLVLHTTDKDAFVEGIIFSKRTLDLDEILSYVDITHLDGERKKQFIDDIKEILSWDFWEKEKKRWEKIGDNGMVINLGFGPSYVPKPKGDCSSCMYDCEAIWVGDHYEYNGHCAYKREHPDAKCSVGNGMEHWVKKEDDTRRCSKCETPIQELTKNVWICVNETCTYYRKELVERLHEKGE